MKFAWDPNKNRKLKEERHISFEEIVEAILLGHTIDVADHPNKTRYAHQKIFLVLIRDYIYMVPCVETKEGYFLKTIIPNRKLTKEFLSERNGHEN